MRVRPFLLGAATALFAAAPILAQVPAPGGRGGRGGGRGGGAGADTGGAEGVPAVEKVSTTQHKITIDGKEIAYTANTGTMVLHDENGKPKATVFYISYTRDGENAATRPVTFFYNGGPGSASIWLDMGIMSPMHPDMGPNGSQPAPPYNLVANPNSPLDVTDLVQVDAMMTGYSRPGPGVNVTDFTGDRNDIAMFGEFIRDYLDKYNRWASPKYLFGESYGTFRSAGLASELQENEGIELNGVMLLGTVLDFQTIAQSPSNDLAFATFLPTFTATAWYHKKLPARPAEAGPRAGGAAGAGLRVRRLPHGARQGQRADAGRTHRNGAEDRTAHRGLGAVRAQHQPPHRRRHVSHRAAAWPARDGGAL